MRKEYDFGTLRPARPRYARHLKRAVTMRLDAKVVAYFRSLAVRTGIPYQTLINYVLSDYADQGLEPSANWKAGAKRRGRAPGSRRKPSSRGQGRGAAAG
jgi:hypothetical protein